MAEPGPPGCAEGIALRATLRRTLVSDMARILAVSEMLRNMAWDGAGLLIPRFS